MDWFGTFLKYMSIFAAIVAVIVLISIVVAVTAKPTAEERYRVEYWQDSNTKLCFAHSDRAFICVPCDSLVLLHIAQQERR